MILEYEKKIKLQCNGSQVVIQIGDILECIYNTHLYVYDIRRAFDGNIRIYLLANDLITTGYTTVNFINNSNMVLDISKGKKNIKPINTNSLVYKIFNKVIAPHIHVSNQADSELNKSCMKKLGIRTK